MGKKLIGIAVIAIMLFGIFGLTGCDNVSLADYKETKITELQAYADAKGENNYCTDGWDAICKAVTVGKVAISEATTKPAVDTAVDTAKAEINAVSKKSKGSFYSLQEAYDKGFLTVEDLQNLAYYHNDDSMPLYPETLSAEVEKAIKETRASDLHNSQASASNATAADVTVLAYYGSYAGSVAVRIADNFTVFGQTNWTETVEGIDFYYGDGNKILIWKRTTKMSVEDDMEEEIKNQIIQSAWDVFFVAEYPNATIDDVYIEQYFGNFFESVVITVWLKGFEPTRDAVYFTFGKYEFSFSGNKQIRVWRNGAFYNLQEAVDEGFIKIENIKTIHELWSIK